jgi:ubiquitin
MNEKAYILKAIKMTQKQKETKSEHSQAKLKRGKG